MTSWSSHLMKTSAGLILAVVLILTALGGIYALWQTQVSAPEAVVTAGHTDLAITSPTGITAQPLYPGQRVTAGFNADNTGTVPLALQVDSLTAVTGQTGSGPDDLARSLLVEVWANTGTGCDTLPDQAWNGAVGSPPDELDTVVEAGATQPMCLAVTMDPEAPNTVQGASVDLQLTVGGIQR